MSAAMLRPPTPYDLKRQSEEAQARALRRRSSVNQLISALVASAILLTAGVFAYPHVQPTLTERWAQLAERATRDAAAERGSVDDSGDTRNEAGEQQAQADSAVSTNSEPRQQIESSRRLEREIAEHVERALQQFDAKRYDVALKEYHAAIALDPENPDLYVARGGVRLKLKETGRALDDFRRALQIDGAHIDAHRSIAWALTTAPTQPERDGQTALEHARRANSASNERDPDVLVVLALAYAETGAFEDAVRVLDRATSLGTPDPEIADEIKVLRARFQQRKTFPLVSQPEAPSDPASVSSASVPKTTLHSIPALVGVWGFKLDGGQSTGDKKLDELRQKTVDVQVLFTESQNFIAIFPDRDENRKAFLLVDALRFDSETSTGLEVNIGGLLGTDDKVTAVKGDYDHRSFRLIVTLSLPEQLRSRWPNAAIQQELLFEKRSVPKTSALLGAWRRKGTAKPAYIYCDGEVLYETVTSAKQGTSPAIAYPLLYYLDESMDAIDIETSAQRGFFKQHPMRLVGDDLTIEETPALYSDSDLYRLNGSYSRVR